MNETTAKLIQQMADNLGTTSKYLWSVLLKQAPIDSTITLIQIILVVIFGYVLYKLHIKFSEETDTKYSMYDNSNGVLGTIMILASIIWAILAIAGFFCIDDVINGYFNPEYWALNKILNTIK